MREMDEGKQEIKYIENTMLCVKLMALHYYVGQFGLVFLLFPQKTMRQCSSVPFVMS